MTNDFKKARMRLVAMYLCIIGGIIMLFSLLVVYQAQDSFLDPSVVTDDAIVVTSDEAIVLAERAIPDGEILETEYEIERNALYFTSVFTDEREVKVNLLTGTAIIHNDDEGIIETVTDDFEEMVGWIGALVFLLSALLCVYVANKTLDPISRNIKKQKQFVSDVAHEFRNPLASLHARIESVVRSGTEVFRREVLDDLLCETKHLIHMSENLLALEKGEHGVKHIEPQSVVLIVNAVMGRLSHIAEAKHIDAQVDIGTESLTIDKGDLETILYNLVHNAFKFTPNGGWVKIMWSKKVLCVSDNGIGISEEDSTHIFNRFYKADLARTQEGSGLGLSLVKEISDRYGAKTRVESVLGKGTTISIQFK